MTPTDQIIALGRAIQADLYEWAELKQYGLVVSYDNGAQGMANGWEECRIPLCNDEETLP